MKLQRLNVLNKVVNSLCPHKWRTGSWYGVHVGTCGYGGMNFSSSLSIGESPCAAFHPNGQQETTLPATGETDDWNLLWELHWQIYPKRDHQAEACFANWFTTTLPLFEALMMWGLFPIVCHSCHNLLSEYDKDQSFCMQGLKVICVFGCVF